MTELILPALFNLRRFRGAQRRVFVVLDRSRTGPAAEFLRAVRPWSSWMAVTGVVEATRASASGVAEMAAVAGSDLVLLVSQDWSIGGALRNACHRHGLEVVDASLPPHDSRDLALLQEVIHHDIELGGHNEWTGGDSQFGPAVVQTLSAVHCRRRYPGYVDAFVESQQVHGPVRALDIGCGALSRLRWGALNGSLVVTGVDPLLDMYAVVRERHGLSGLPAIRCAHEVCADAEALREVLAPGSFDLAYCANALDHVADPVAVIDALAHVLRPGGVLAIEVFTREGSRENWWQLHQFDMYANEAGEFVCETRDGAVWALLHSGGALRVHRYVSNTPDTTWVVAERVA